MLKFNLAKKIILENINQLPAETITLNENCLNTVIAENIISSENIPNCDNSAMDGYAVKYSDIQKIPALLKVVGEVKAGDIFSKKLSAKGGSASGGKKLFGEAVKIMTGAPIPKGADVVVMVEDTEKQITNYKLQITDFVKILKTVERGANIRKAGEDIKNGEMILKKGMILNPAQIGLLASIGKIKIRTVKRPKVAIITTGDEIVDASVKKLPKGKVRNSNLWTITALLKRDGAIPIQLGTVPDNLSKTKSAIRKTISLSDAVIISAGISVGEYDFVRVALKQLGAKFIISQVAMKPGKPFAFSKIRSVPIFSLPGNPVSTMVTYEELVRPAILKMMGKQSTSLLVVKAIIQDDIYKKHGRKEFIRGVFTKKGGEYFVELTGTQGSGILKSMSKANCFIVLDEKTLLVQKGSEVNIEILNKV
ncbi:MAG: gephyrin-like molybdotransferase Glp [Elusimicrobiota bacterium]